ncbi:hypothetical protein AB688_03035 [Pseudomonas putida]|uniref:site-specific integrase n=1 Tax=Pseudomonas putida TaxID=303 RepID=UPI0007B6D385|nr:site-specific integrase [Pseudomonas putida]ANC01148.1 hypothetical protein AB688_03035 [Pseudomonas putida]
MYKLDVPVPNLKFTGVAYGIRETPLDLKILLYYGGAATDIRKFEDFLSKGKFGPPLFERLPLLVRIHSVIQTTITAGGSRFTAKTSIHCLRQFYSWAEQARLPLSLSSIDDTFIAWTDHLLSRQRRDKTLKTVTIAGKATIVSSLLDQALDLKIGLYRSTRIPKKYNKKKVLGTNADKTKLSESFDFGTCLLDIVNALSSEAIRGSLPVRINFRNGRFLDEWSGLRPADTVKYLLPGHGSSVDRKKVREARERWEKDASWRTRFPLINLRIQAELLIFISQTGMNLSQAHKLKIEKCTFQSFLGGYQVRRVYKGRRQGEIEFEIFSEYREVFERYLRWRNDFFPDNYYDLLFPESSPQKRSKDIAPKFQAIRRICKKLNVRYISPRELRKTRVNWLIRTSKDVSLTSEIAQHTQQTLLQVYDQPHHQCAVSEISKFHAFTEKTYEPPGPGTCINPTPSPQNNSPPLSPAPNCLSAAGCIFCAHHRDLDDADHVWSLASYRHYKSLELTWSRALVMDSSDSPAMLTIERLTEKLNAFKLSSSVRALWVIEALDRIEEGYYHPKWSGFIQLIEVCS